ncbi:MAG: ATP-binding cassette domain-containing protein, partial [Candidatus Marinimicrobia bacterium]|nr:ATP-binding cassette domain-containing protein [Candidatus Neomarinimicrobiota bacterium]
SRDMGRTVEAGETVVFIGPSGGGKTTALKMVNGLVQPSSGRITVQGKPVSEWDIKALRQSIGYVIQQVGLFPHWTVARNIAILPQLAGWSRAERDRRVDELLELVDLEPASFRDRYPHELSGGQAQRIGVARALALRPAILLMDEPFGALDPLIRAQLQAELLRILAQVQTTTLLVTHDLPEAFRMGDRIAVLVNGRVEQIDTPENLLRHPTSPFLKQLMEAELIRPEGGNGT